MSSPWISLPDHRVSVDGVSDTDDELLPAMPFQDNVFKVTFFVNLWKICDIY